MTCIRQTGRNSWLIVSHNRVHSVRIPGSIEPLDYPKAKATAWNVIATATWIICGLYAVSLWVS